MTPWKPPDDWELAGILTESGEVDRSSAFKHLRVPKTVSVDGDRLRWGSEQGFAVSKTLPPGPRLLLGFLRLADADPREVLAYSQQWGVLGICEHGLPATHNYRTSSDPPGTGCRPAHDGTFWEPVEAWRDLAQQARALLGLAAALRQGQLGTTADWNRVGIVAPADIEGQRLFMSFVVNRFLNWGNTRIRFSWGDSPTLHIGGPSLYSVLALQLAQAVVAGSLVFCSGCGSTYEPGRRPRKDHRQYCPDCQSRGVPLRDAKREQRARARRRPRLR
jgi:hypothetical protein